MQWHLLAPSADIVEFARSERAQFDRLFAPTIIRSMLEGGRAPIDLWPSLVEQGYLSVGLPEDADGIGTLADLACILEQAGRSLIPLPLMTTATALQTLVRSGIPLPGIEGGPIALALAGDSRVFDAAEAALVVEVDKASVRLLEVRSATVVPGEIDSSRAAAVVIAGRVVGEVSLDGVGLDGILAPARVCVAADLVGTASRAFEGAVEHAKRRVQFGRPIGSFQGVKHQLADAYVNIERARSLTVGAAAELTTRPDQTEGVRLSMLAKAAAGDAATAVTALYVQLLGAMGLTYESDAHLLVRRARQTAGFLGSSSDLYAAAAASLLDEATRG